MEREDTVIELGAASTETQGAQGGGTDLGISRVPFGLSDD